MSTTRLSLGELRNLISDYERKLESLYEEREDVSYVLIIEGEKEKHDTTVEAVSDEINKTATVIRNLRLMANIGNNRCAEEVDGQSYTLSELVVYRGQLKKEQEALSKLTRRRKRERKRTLFEENKEVSEITYDINKIKTRLSDTNRKLRLVKQALDRGNINSYVDVPTEYVGI